VAWIASLRDGGWPGCRAWSGGVPRHRVAGLAGPALERARRRYAVTSPGGGPAAALVCPGQRLVRFQEAAGAAAFLR